MALNQDIQLLPEKRTRLELGGDGGKTFFILGLTLMAVSIVLVFIVTWYKTSLEQEISQIDSELVVLESKRDKKFESDLMTLDKQLSLVVNLLDNHTYLSIALNKVEKLLQSRIQITRLEFKESSLIVLDGVAANYSTVAKQIAAFLTDSSVEDVGLKGVKANNEGRVEFSMEIKVKPKSLLKDEPPK